MQFSYTGDAVVDFAAVLFHNENFAEGTQLASIAIAYLFGSGTIPPGDKAFIIKLDPLSDIDQTSTQDVKSMVTLTLVKSSSAI
jgi:hypothetical protein